MLHLSTTTFSICRKVSPGTKMFLQIATFQAGSEHAGMSIRHFEHKKNAGRSCPNS